MPGKSGPIRGNRPIAGIRLWNPLCTFRPLLGHQFSAMTAKRDSNPKPAAASRRESILLTYWGICYESYADDTLTRFTPPQLLARPLSGLPNMQVQP
jgi:hypothetical protein